MKASSGQYYTPYCNLSWFYFIASIRLHRIHQSLIGTYQKEAIRYYESTQNIIALKQPSVY